jgi:diadenosine tetraphosphate (Ap4A) HIT family hydrolase
MSRRCASCIFCRIVANELPAVKIAETDLSLAFLDISPLSAGHTLVIPKEHQERYNQLSQASVVDLSLLLHKVAQAVDPHGEQAYNILQNNGQLAHQAVFHVHFHVIPKNSTRDGLGLRWEQMPKFSDAEMKSFADRLRSQIAENEAKAAEKK